MAFGTRVRNAVKAEPRSVRLSSLVGAGGLWYGFGKMIADMCANNRGYRRVMLISIYRLTEEQGLELEAVLTQVRNRCAWDALARTMISHRRSAGVLRKSLIKRSTLQPWDLREVEGVAMT